MAEVISGAPQDSVIGPILFVIYVIDLPSHLVSDSLFYAEGAKIVDLRSHQKVQSYASTLSKTNSSPMAIHSHSFADTIPSHNPTNTQTNS